jgi:hypothetical protein
VLVLGAHGFFGRHAVALLRADGIAAVPVGHDQADVEDRASLRSLIHANDVLLDTVGPFQRRTHALLDVALERKADLVDLSDSTAYARSIAERSADIAAQGIAVLTVQRGLRGRRDARASGDVGDPLRSTRGSRRPPGHGNVATIVVPASVRSARANVRIRAGARHGRRVRSPCSCPRSGHARCGVLGRPHTRGAGPLLGLAARSAVARRALDAFVPLGVWLAGWRTRAGLFAVRVEGSAGIARWVLRAPAATPAGPRSATLHARLAAGGRGLRGLVPADQQVTIDAARVSRPS